MGRQRNKSIGPLPRELARGAFTLEREIGRGGMAVVYEARVDLSRFDFPLLLARRDLSRGASRDMLADSGPLPEPWSEERVREFSARCEERGLAYPRSTRVAVKVLESTLEHVERRFVDEWLSLMGISHPHVVAVYNGGIDNELGRHYYAMELLAGLVDKKHVIESPFIERLDAVRQAALGLRALHERGLIHRDVKPENLMCSRAPVGGWRVKVSDLGIAKDLQRSMLLTATEQTLGTPHYMAPEVFGDSRSASQRSDVYGLGASLYTLLTGAAPYQRESLYGMLCKLRSRTPPTAPHVLDSTVPRAAEWLVTRMMAYDPTERPSGMDVVVESIDMVMRDLHGEPPHFEAVLPQPGRVSRAGHRVLIVEPDETLRGHFCRLLSAADFHIEAAATGAEALLRIGRGDLALVLASYDLPDLDGPSLIRVLASNDDPPPVLLLLGANSPTDQQTGAAAAVRKAAPLIEVVEAIERCIAGRMRPLDADSA